MTIRYIQTNNNKYVQYRLMATDFRTTKSDWQGVDDEPLDKSPNLVKSGGVRKQIDYIEKKSLIITDPFTPISTVAGDYVNMQGNISTGWASSVACYYAVTPGDKICIESIYGSFSQIAAKYAFYPVSSGFSSDNVISIVGPATESYKDVIVVPENAVTLIVTRIGSSNSLKVGYPKGLADDGVINRNIISDDSFDTLPTLGSNKMMQSGDIALLINDIIQKSFVEGEPFNVVQQLEGFINSAGNIGSWTASLIYLYAVTPRTIINIFSGKGRSTAVCKYAFYSSSTLSSATLIQVSEKSTDKDYEDNVIVPLGASYLGVSVVDGAYTRVSLIAGLNDYFDEMFQLADIPFAPDNVASGKYISASNGTIAEYVSYKLAIYNVSPGDKIKIKRTPSSMGISMIYNIYSTSDISQLGSSTALISYSRNITYVGDTEITIDVPDNAACIAVSQYPGGNYIPSVYKLERKSVNYGDFLDLENDVARLGSEVEQISGEVARNFCVELANDGENLYIAYLKGTTEFTYWFKKCMANELYTFYRVGFRSVSRNYADTVGISGETGITYLNSTSSDNIGPLGFDNGGLVGGNHVWNNDNELRCKTAKNDSYEIYANGKQLVAGDKLFTDKVIVKVVNTLYNPAETPSQGQTILTIPASTETVIYEINENNISVSVRQKLADNNNNILNRYYGMQSMFSNKQYYITPRGQYVDWTSVADHHFKKQDYPNFNRFVEKSTSGYQSTYLIPNKAGSHSLLGNDSNIWSYGGIKEYHQIFAPGNFTESTPGFQFVWSGVYTFFTSALLDDNNVLVYDGIINGKHAIFINTKRACSINIPLLEKYYNKAIKEVERDTTITTENTFVDIDGIAITATGTGSFIFKLNE